MNARRLIGVTLLAAVGAAGLAADPVALPGAMAGLRAGMWEVRVTDGPREAPQRLCIADPAQLVQVRHRAASCSRLVIEDAPRTATVHYSCPAAGWGRTTIRIQGPDAVRIETQGIADNAPFAFVAEARRAGDCATARASVPAAR